jgi:hypothetical protein
MEDKFIETMYKSEILSNEYMADFIEDFMKKNNLKNSLKGIGFVDPNDEETKRILNGPLGYSNKWIVIDYERMINDILNYYNIKNYINGEQLTKVNLTIIQMIYHELVHAIQYDIIDGYRDANFDIADLLDNSFYNAHSNRELYYKYHDLFLTEFNANMESAFLTDEFYDKVIKKVMKIDNPYLDESIKIYLSNGYYIDSPLDKYNKLTKQKLNPAKGLNTYEKIIYGMPINNNEYEKVKKLAIVKKENNNLKEYLIQK